jgi:nucleotide-binding universal stress UspA family protein
MLVKRILVPVDFSKDSLNAVTYAAEFAQPFGAELLLLYVVEPIYYATPTDPYAVNANVAVLIEEQRRLGEQQLARIGADLEKKGQRFRALIKSGSPPQQITDTAKRQRANLIIMATHGRTGLAHMFMGSVAEKVVRTAACPVLTVRSTARPRKKPSAGKR